MARGQGLTSRSGTLRLTGDKILESHSVSYTKTTLTQCGYEITGAKVELDPTYGMLLTPRECVANRYQGFSDDLLNKYGIGWDEKVYVNFNIYLDLNHVK